MYKHKKIEKLDDFFTQLDHRMGKGVYFYRINGYTGEIGKFIQDYYQAARRSGVIQEGKIPNPDEKNLSYYNEIMGGDFQASFAFISESLKKWLPRMDSTQRDNVASSMYASLDSLQKMGKNASMLKNAYIKLMCWLYYKFERIVNQLGKEDLPKILYEGQVSGYELMLLSVLSCAGCDIVLLQYHGDQEYRKLDRDSVLSEPLEIPGMGEFPPNFSLRWVREQIQNAYAAERLCGEPPNIRNCTNAWMDGKGMEDFKKDIRARGDDPRFFYNCFCRISGVEDKLTYLDEWRQFQLELKKQGRNLVVAEGQIERPSMEEIAAIRRKNYGKQEQMLMDLAQNIQYSPSRELQRVMVKAFIDVMLMEAETVGMNLHKLTNKAVYLLCWLKRWQGALFPGWKPPEVSCWIYLGGCQDENEALFARFLARLPVDVLILRPDLGRACCLQDSALFELHYAESLPVLKFPREGADVRMGTAAYHAERELDSLMYQDSGLYRNRQYAKANVITLQTMYEEIPILWKEEVQYRPNFSILDGVVQIPVIYAKISGVKDGQISQYWKSVRELVTEDTFVIRGAPFISPAADNPMKAHVAEFLKRGKIQKTKIKSHPQYPYGFLREEMQDYILEKLQLLIDRRTIRGTLENGTEYTIAAVVLNLPMELARLIQKFDFTKRNPKLLYIHTGESMISLEDSILAAFLNLVGFDIVFFIPTGYENIEKYFQAKPMEEHQAGEYVFGMQVPNLERGSARAHSRWRDIIFKRGG